MKSTMPSISLIGFSGAGKSTIGPIIAEEFGLPFFDLDTEYEEVRSANREPIRAGAPAKDKSPERANFANSLLAIAEGKVVALGYDDFSPEIAMGSARKHSLSVWIKADKGARLGKTYFVYAPLFAKFTEEQQETIYACADLTVDVKDLPAPAAADQVIQAINTHLGR